MIKNMYKPAQIASALMDELFKLVSVGMTTKHINDFCHEYIVSRGGRPATLNYKGFPASICASVNSIVCHGIPNEYMLKSGDLISIDIVIEYEGYYADNCITIGVGPISPREQKLIEVSHDAMWNAIQIIKPGVSVKKLGEVMEATANQYGFKVIRDFCGHGIGEVLHKDPSIPFYGCEEDEQIYLEEGKYITIEPMLTLGNHKLSILADGWSAKMNDHKKTSQFEHTIYIGASGYEVLTYNSYDALRSKPQAV